MNYFIRKNEIIINVGTNKQIILTGYDWRTSLFNIYWHRFSKLKIRYFCFELCRFKIDFQDYGSPTLF